MPTDVVRVLSRADGQPSPHDGRWVVAWNPHTVAGVCEITTTTDVRQARRFKPGEAFEEWTTVSRAQKRRPWDDQLNRPLCGLTVEIEPAPDANVN